MDSKSLSPADKWIWAGIPAMFAIGTLFHFLYELLGGSPAAGILAPVNESVWEHGKLVLWPGTIWWFLGWVLRKPAPRETEARRWFSGALASLLGGRGRRVPAVLFLHPGLWPGTVVGGHSDPAGGRRPGPGPGPAPMAESEAPVRGAAAAAFSGSLPVIFVPDLFPAPYSLVPGWSHRRLRPAVRPRGRALSEEARLSAHGRRRPRAPPAAGKV